MHSNSLDPLFRRRASVDFSLPSIFIVRMIALLAMVALCSFKTVAAGLPKAAADNSLAALINEGKDRKLDYVIENVIMTVRLDATTNTITPKVADVEIVYTIYALNAVTNFDEQYHAMTPEAEVLRIHGSHPESDFIQSSPTLKEWVVSVKLQPGQQETLVTSARYLYPNGVPEKRTIRDFKDLTPAEDVYAYPNADDVIGDLTIRIESSLPVKPPKSGDALLAGFGKNHNAAKRTSVARRYAAEVPGSTPDVVIGHWKNLLPNEIAELKISR